MKTSIILIGIAGIVVALIGACSEGQPDRAGLIGVMDRYLEERSITWSFMPVTNLYIPIFRK